jgi:hypothetical protein
MPSLNKWNYSINGYKEEINDIVNEMTIEEPIKYFDNEHSIGLFK